MNLKSITSIGIKVVLYTFFGLIFLIIFSWLSEPLIEWWSDFATSMIITPLGVNHLPDYLSHPVEMIILAAPFYVIVYTPILVFLRSNTRVGNRFSNQIRKIDEAKGNLKSSIKYLDELRRSVEKKSGEHDQLSGLIEQLDSVSKEKAHELRKKLDAISYVNRRDEMRKFFFSFVLGVVASVIASAIWEVVSNSRSLG